LSPIANTPSSLTAPKRFLKARSTRKRLPDFALEIQHRVDHVFEHARPGDAAFLGDVPDQEYGAAGLPSRTAPGARRDSRTCAHRTRERRQRSLRIHGLDGVDATSRRGIGLLAYCLRQNALDAGLGQCMRCARPAGRGAARAGDLRRGFLAGDVQRLRSGPASAASACNTRVDLPMPGSPPISTTEPRTSPPPSTRSSSPIADFVEARRTSDKVFQALHSVHCPCHFEYSAPQSLQT
jgi:hypothetical protein